MYLRLREAKSGTEINLAEFAALYFEYLERRDKLLINITYRLDLFFWKRYKASRQLERAKKLLNHDNKNSIVMKTQTRL